MISIKESTYKGTRILLGDQKRNVINKAVHYLSDHGFIEISIPIIQKRSIFSGKVGEENNNMMFNLTDRGNRSLCLAPEYTAVIQELSKTTFKYEKDVKVFYIQECFRGEKPQAGRYRQFTQLGVEIINPSQYYIEDLIDHALEMISFFGVYDVDVNRDVVRGLDYYKGGKGFEVTYDKLGISKQVCGGGEYEGGIGFAIGVDRLINV